MMAKKQKMVVNTKGGLLAAFECCKDVSVDSIIHLHTKSGKIIKYEITRQWCVSEQEERSKIINRIKAKIRKIPARELIG